MSSTFGTPFFGSICGHPAYGLSFAIIEVASMMYGDDLEQFFDSSNFSRPLGGASKWGVRGHLAPTPILFID